MVPDQSGQPRELIWRSAEPDDLDTIMAIQSEVHTMLPERREVFAAKLELFAEGCRMLIHDGEPVGYAVAHPWTLGHIPALDTIISIPLSPDCLFLHDGALRRAARRHGAGRSYVAEMAETARKHRLASLALVSVYDSRQAWGSCGFHVEVLPGMLALLSPFGDTARYMTRSSYDGSAVLSET